MMMTTRRKRTSTTNPGTVASLESRERRLTDLLASFESVVVAFSGGVDSAYLAWAATKTLGASALCVTADSPSYPDHHRQLALRIAREFQLHHEIIATAEMERAEYRANPVNRCYYCKHELYTSLSQLASARGFGIIADGSNADDRADYRPGRMAAREFGVRSPLDEADLTKDDIRELSRRAGLPTWDEPASACLSSRIPYGSEVSGEKLRMIERAERVLRELGFRICRVRHHDSPSAGQALARLEIGREELARALEPSVRDQIVRQLRALGYAHVTIDLQGYRMGSLNEGVVLRPA
jgi:pyridinium-3,5-biscarboxylic acid mononucleotide sulfurtransferase